MGVKTVTKSAVFKIKILIFSAAAFSIAGIAAGSLKGQVTEERSEGDLINWTTGKIQSSSAAKLPRLIQNPSNPEFRSPDTAASLTEARSDARVRASERAKLQLMQTIMEIPLNGDYTLRDLLEESPEFRESAGDLPSWFKTVIRITGESSVTETMEISFRGEKGLYRSLAYALHRSNRIPVPITDSSGPEGISDPVTGVIIDATHIKEFRPSLLPRIYNEKGRLIYSHEMLSRGALIHRGPVVYYRDYNAARKDGRAGNNPYYLTAAGAVGTLKADLFLDDAEVDRILSSEQGREALRKGSVIILTDTGR